MTSSTPADQGSARSRPSPPRTPSVGAFLARGLLAGLLAGLAAFAVAYLVGEPSVRSAITLEDVAGGHAVGHDGVHDQGGGTTDDHAEDVGTEGGTVVPRSLQSTAGLATGTLLAGVTLGGFWGLLSALALGRLGRTGPRATALTLAAAGFVAVQLVPFAAYPPNPPGVGADATIGVRTGSYFVLLAISVLAAAAALLAGRGLRARWGAWHAGLAAVAGYLLVVGVAVALLPGFAEVPSGFPAELLYRFRAASLLTQLTLWGVLGVALAELTARLVTVRVPAPQPLPAVVRPC